jgi:hypothetical protein
VADIGDIVRRGSLNDPRLSARPTAKEIAAAGGAG